MPLGDENGKKAAAFSHVVGAETLEIQAVSTVNPDTGVPVDFATQATVSALLTAANAIKTAAESLNGKTVAINTGAIYGTVELGAASLASINAAEGASMASATESAASALSSANSASGAAGSAAAALISSNNAQTYSNNASGFSTAAQNYAASAANSAASASNLIASSTALASKIEAELGADNSKYMSALRVKQSILANVIGALPASTTVNVKSFGAVGDGIADDRASIQSAIDSISRGTIIFPSGNYLIGSNGSGVGLVHKEGVTLLSYGTSASLLCGANSMKLISFTNPSITALAANFNIVGLQLVSNGMSGCIGINVDGNVSASRCSLIKFSELQIIGTFDTAIKITYCANNYMSNIFISGAINGVEQINCADSDYVNVKVQFGSGVGFDFTGGAGAFDEGTRLSNCSTNGQAIGLRITGQDWGIATGCSFTTCSGGPLISNGTCLNWKFASCEFAAGVIPSTGVTLSSGSSKFNFTGCLVSNNTFGMVLGGTFHVISACHFDANSNADLYLNSTSHVNVNASIMNSTGVAQSIYEVTSNYSNINGNQVNGTIVLVGANSTQSNNTQY